MNSLQANALSRLPDIEPEKNRGVLANFMNYAPEGYLLFDKNLKLKLFNQTIQLILGFPKDSAGKHITEIAPYLKNSIRLAKYKEIIRTGESFSFSNISIELSSQTFNIRAFKVGDDLGIIVTDITEFKQIEDDLISRNAEIQRYVDNLITMNARIDTDGVFIMINKKAVEAAGIKSSDIIGTKVWNGAWFTYDRRVQERVKKNIAKAALGKSIFYEERLNTKNGFMDAAIRLSPVMSKDGTVSYIIIECHDISSLKRTAKKLKKSKNDLQSYVDTLVTLNGKVAKNGKLLMVNRTALLTTRQSRNELRGIDFCDTDWFAYDQKVAGRLKDGLDRCQAGEAVSYEEKIMTIRGLIDIQFHLTPIYDDAGEVEYLMAEGQEITALKKAEKNLIAAKEAAEDADRIKSEFLANMSHEIRTPMNGILGFTDILLGDELNSKQRDSVETIKKSGENLLLLINDILDLSRIESNRIELESIPFNPEDLIYEVGALARIKMGEKPVEINCVTDDIPASLTGDPTRLRRIITNLADNAVKFTKQGEILFSVSVAKETDKNILLNFSVRDSGIGIPPDKFKIIFETFRQVDSSTNRKYGGSGLGLAISKELAVLMGGEMWVSSPAYNKEEKETYGYGAGSVFHFTALFKKDLSGKAQNPQGDISGLEGKEVLIVDDNKAALHILENIIKKAKMTPVLAKTGAEALKIINKRPTEVALIDLTLRDMPGTELAAKIDQLTKEKTKLIALTPAPVPASKGNKSKFAGLLSKPVRYSAVINMIKSIFGLQEKEPEKSRTIPIKNEIMAHAVKILYAEDNLVNQKLGEKMFKRMGYQIKIAPDGLRALKLVTGRGDYDIIFMDMQMPNMDGLQATREIRKWEKTLKKDITNQHARIPIIALTANAMKGDREKCIQAGMDDYMSKPFKPEDLQKMTQKWSGKGKPVQNAVKNRRILLVEDEEKLRKSIMIVS